MCRYVGGEVRWLVGMRVGLMWLDRWSHSGWVVGWAGWSMCSYIDDCVVILTSGYR